MARNAAASAFNHAERFMVRKRLTDLDFERSSAKDGEMSLKVRCWRGTLARADVACSEPLL
jgi:hypothetical protein